MNLRILKNRDISWLSYCQLQTSQGLCYLLQSSPINTVAALSRLFLKILVVDELAAKSHNFPISNIFPCSQALQWTQSWTTWLQPTPSLFFYFRYVLIRNSLPNMRSSVILHPILLLQHVITPSPLPEPDDCPVSYVRRSHVHILAATAWELGEPLKIFV